MFSTVTMAYTAQMKHCVCFILVMLVLSEVSCSSQTGSFTIPNSAMEPTILQGEKVAAEMRPFQVSRGDLVIFAQEGQLFIKRVIGIGGDTLEGRNLQVFVNGKLLDEPYIEHIGKRPLGLKSLETFGPVTVPAGKLFVAGDNRDYSFDSRDTRFGLISTADVKGKPLEIVQSASPDRVHKPVR
ncbi:MAG TPA: signal peptidase I [Terriglobales bacterium]|nr:signal peptidase I [Terriglobales bacterium]